VLSRLRNSDPARPARADGGFTLIELVIAIAILGVVMSAVCAAMVTALRANQETKTRLAKSGDVQFSSTWFADDIAGANKVTTGGTASCGTSATALVDITSTDIDTTVAGVPATPPPTPEATTRSVSYVLATVSDGDGTFRQLERRACVGPGAAEVNRVARRLSTTATPTVTRTPDTATPATVTLTLTADDGTTFTLTGNRRSS
jgi:prepilin-type N-terminal cleavage/methylation domain-containing protein